MNRAALAQEPGPEVLEHPIRLEQGPREALGSLRVVLVMNGVLLEGNGGGDFAGGGVDGHLKSELKESTEQGAMEIGHTAGLEGQLPELPITRLDHQLMIEEIEHQLEQPGVAWNR